MPHSEGTFAGHDNLPLFEQAWLPEGQPRAVVVLVHGLLEHSGRHAETAEALVGEGYAVYAMDLRGHGRSEGPRCDVGSFDEYLLDLDIFFGKVKSKYANLPIFLFGNSMGGLIAGRWSIRRNVNLAGLILTGPLLAVADEFMPRLRHLASIGSLFFPKLRVAQIDPAWLSRNAEAVASYRRDPLFFQGRFTVRLGAEALCAIKQLPADAMQLRVPLLILHGSADMVCGVAGSRQFCEKASSSDKTLQVYDGLYHELLDEPERDRVMADLTAWLGGRVPTTASTTVAGACPLLQNSLE